MNSIPTTIAPFFKGNASRPLSNNSLTSSEGSIQSPINIEKKLTYSPSGNDKYNKFRAQVDLLKNLPNSIKNQLFDILDDMQNNINADIFSLEKKESLFCRLKELLSPKFEDDKISLIFETSVILASPQSHFFRLNKTTRSLLNLKEQLKENQSWKSQFQNEISYFGELNSQEQPHGWGKMTFHKNKDSFVEGDVYEGLWLNGKQNGFGILFFANGQTYSGSWQNGLQNGYGKLLYLDKSFYEGHWRDGKQNGFGKHINSYWDIYSGEFENGVYHGQGKITYANGDLLEGHWTKGKIICKGEKHAKMTYSDGSVYEGEWRICVPHGEGRIVHFSKTEPEMVHGQSALAPPPNKFGGL